MPRPVQKSVACILIALLAIISGVGEGLHWIPGSGHGVPMGGSVLWLGIELPEPLQVANDLPRVESPRGKAIPIFDEDQCAICSALGASYTSADSAPSVLVLPLVQDLPPVVLRSTPDTNAHCFQARAPPLA